jgi:hypothetical protein
MGALSTIDKQINHYLLHLNEKQKKAVLKVVKTFAEEQEYSPWENTGFHSEMDRRLEELESGNVQGRSREEVKQKARRSIKDKK